MIRGNEKHKIDTRSISLVSCPKPGPHASPARDQRFPFPSWDFYCPLTSLKGTHKHAGKRNLDCRLETVRLNVSCEDGVQTLMCFLQTAVSMLIPPTPKASQFRDSHTEDRWPNPAVRTIKSSPPHWYLELYLCTALKALGMKGMEVTPAWAHLNLLIVRKTEVSVSHEPSPGI